MFITVWNDFISSNDCRQTSRCNRLRLNNERNYFSSYELLSYYLWLSLFLWLRKCLNDDLFLYFLKVSFIWRTFDAEVLFIADCCSLIFFVQINFHHVVRMGLNRAHHDSDGIIIWLLFTFLYILLRLM